VVAPLAVSLNALAEVGQFIAGVTSIIVLGSLYFVWRQVKQQAQDSRVELITGMTSLIGSVSQVFIEKPEMRKYFYEGISPSGDEVELAQAIAVRMADALDHVAAHLDLMSDPTRDAWAEYISGIGERSPVLKSYVRANKKWYGPKLREQLSLD
jgi:hypothetical protein